jgi:hypothetical protein
LIPGARISFNFLLYINFKFVKMDKSTGNVGLF